MHSMYYLGFSSERSLPFGLLVCNCVSFYFNRNSRHYDNTSVRYTAIFHCCKKSNFHMKNSDVFLSFGQNID